MSVKITTVKAQDNAFNAFLADEDKVSDQMKATVTVDGKEFSGMGDTKEDAIEDLKERIDSHFSGQKHIAKVEIDKALGQFFFE